MRWRPWNSGRGSSAFGGTVDTILTLRRPEGKTRSTLRVIRSLSRFDEVPAELLIDLTPQGYVPLGTGQAVARREAEEALAKAAPDSESAALTLDHLCDSAGLARSTAQRALAAMLKDGRLVATGSGKRNSARKFYQNGLAQPESGVWAETKRV